MRGAGKALALAMLAVLGACQGAVQPGPDEDGDEPALDAGQPPDEDAGEPPEPGDDAGEPDAGPPPPDPYQVCSADGWCYEQPYPAAEDLNGAARVSAELSVLVGARGRILHVSPEGVRSVESGTSHDLRAVAAFAPDDVWAVGNDSTFVHFDGQSWTPHAFPADALPPLDELRALWGASGQDIWAVGAAGALWHYDGASWTRQTSVNVRGLHGIWGADATHVYAVGDHSTLLEYDGERWVAATPPGTGSALAIHGSSADDVWVVAGRGRMWHRDASGWVDLMQPLGDVPLRSVLAVSPAEVYVTGDAGLAFRYDGSAWHPLTSGSRESLRALAYDGGALLVGGAHGTLLAFAGDTRTTYSRGSRTNYLDLSAGGATAPWVIGDATLRLTANGPEPVEAGTDRALFGCYAVSDELAWAVGTAGTIVRWDGESMAPLDSGTDRWLRAVWAASETSAWVVGEQGTVLGLLNGTTWQPSAVPTDADLFDVWGAALDDVWIAGDLGTLLHWNGALWSPVETASDARLQSLWGRAADDLWVVGSSGTILHWDGAALDVAQEGEAYALYGVWGDDEATYAVGSGGTVLRHDGTSFRLEQTPTDVTLFGVGRGLDGALRAVGADGVILVKR